MSWIAIAAFVLAIIAFIVIVVAIYIFNRNNELFRALVGRWAIIRGKVSTIDNLARTTDTFVGSANTIYVATSTDLKINIILLTITPPANLNLDFTTKFIIDATSTTANILISPLNASNGVSGSKPFPPDLVRSGTTGTFIWLNSTSIKRLS